MDKEVVLHIHNAILPSHKKELLESIQMRGINLESIIQSEVSQKEEDKYRIQRMYTESRKMVLRNLFTGQQWRNRHRE